MLVRSLLVAWLAASGALALPTADTMVVTRADGESPATTTEASSTTPAPAPPPLKLTEMDVRSDVSMRYARTAVVTHVRNPADRSQEAVFRVLLPETAYISGFQMTLDGVTYKAYVKGKEEAKQIYDKAVSQGVAAAHVAVKARDSNEFFVTVNVEPLVKVTFNLTYEELLVRRNGVYNLNVNLLPGAPVPVLSVAVHVREPQEITVLRVPEVRTGNEIDATESDPRNTGAVIQRSADNREATITFKPDLEEQKRLMAVYAEKSKETQQTARRYFGDSEKEAQGVLGQFVVQYDVKRPKNGDILVNDGYFVHFFAPEELPPLAKLVVFVLDTSGSMMDRKIVQLRQAMQTILDELNEGDYFSIVEFSSGVKVHDLKEADQEPRKQSNYYSYYGLNDNTPVTLLPPYSATKENIEKAKVIISRLDAAGGTNIARALEVAINIVKKGVVQPPAASTGAAGATGAAGETGTDPSPTSEPSATDVPFSTTEVAQTTSDTDKIEERQELESIIVFLTDGEPTVGDVDPRHIVSLATERNAGPRRATIFSLAFGEDADRSFLRKLALKNAGFMRHIYEAADAALQLRDFYRQISSPLLDDVTFVYPPEQVKEDSLTKHKFRTYYAGSEVVVAGRLQADTAELTPQVLGFCGVQDGVSKKRYEVFPRVPVARERNAFLPLERLWVYLTVRQLLDQRDAADGPAADAENKAKALALQYELVTPLTSLVVVKPNATDAVDAHSVDDHANRQYPGSLAAPQSFSSFPSPSGSLAFSSFAAAQAGSSSSGLTLAMEDVNDETITDYDYGFGRTVAMPAHVAYSSAMRRYGHPQYLYPPALPAGGSVVPLVSSNMWLQPSQPGPPSSASVAAPGLSVADSGPRDPRDPLATYHLENYGWTKTLINPQTDELVLQVNGTSVSYKLTRDTAAPRGARDAACARATDGGAGVCVYLTRCAPAQGISPALYADVNCSVVAFPTNTRYAGVCCPSAGVDRPAAAPAPAP